MQSTEILEGNKLIALFMGVAFNKDLTKCNHPLIIAPWPPVECLKYHTSWDWLMPVVKKIYDYLQNIDRPSKNHCCKGDMLEVDITCQIREINILKTHEAVVEWLKWYNTQTKQNIK